MGFPGVAAFDAPFEESRGIATAAAATALAPIIIFRRELLTTSTLSLLFMEISPVGVGLVGPGPQYNRTNKPLRTYAEPINEGLTPKGAIALGGRSCIAKRDPARSEV